MGTDAILQFEIDVKRGVRDIGRNFSDQFVGSTPWGRVKGIANTAVADTLSNGGTFVLVVTDTKITMVQRAIAEDIFEPSPPSREGETG